MGKQAFSVNITADEVIAPGSTIELAFAAPVEEKSAQGAIRVTCGCEPRSVRIEVAKRGRLVRVNVDETVLGACRLVIAELLGAKGERLVDTYGLPFSVAPLPGKLPAGLRVEHAVRLVIGDLHVERVALGKTPAGYVDLVKAVHRTTGRPAELGFDERGKRVDVAGQLEELAARRAAKYGRIHETLYERLEQARGNERIPIVVWPPLDLPPAPYNKATDRRTLEAPAAEQKVLEALRGQASRLRAALKRSEVALVRDQHTDNALPYARATATVTQIRSLAESKNVGVILFDDTSVLTDLGNSIAVARTDRAHLAGFDGTGIRVAVWEDGPSVTTNLTFAGRFTTTPAASDHARLTSAIVKNTEASLPHGHASGLRPLLGQQRQRGRAALGRARPALHGREPELPPRDGARRVNSAVGRPAQGLARAALAVSDDRAGGRELLAGGRGRHQPAGGRVRQSQGLQLPGARQSRRHRRGDVGGLGLPQPGLDARRPRAAGAGRERHRGLGQYRDDVGHELRLAGRRGRRGAAAGRRRGAVLLARGLPRDPDGLGRAQHQRQHVVAGRGEPRRRPRRRRSGRRRVRRRRSPSSAGGETRPALGGAGTSGRSPRA